MPRKAYPEYHKSMMEQTFYPSAPRKIKLEETPHSYLYRTGDTVYKWRKASPVYSSLAIKEAFANEALTLGRRWAGERVRAVVTVGKNASGEYTLGGKQPVLEYGLVMEQVSAHYWMDYLVDHQKLTPTLMGRLAKFLAGVHVAHPLAERHLAEYGRPEHFRGLFEEVLYQVKKYQGKAITPAMIEAISRGMNHFLDDQRKLFIKRQKKGLLTDGHGHFSPPHIYMKSKDIFAIAPLDGQPKYRMLDRANDVAILCIHLCRAKQKELSDLFVKRYVTAAKDRDLPLMLPAYQVFQALRHGLQLCEFVAAEPVSDEERNAAHAQALEWFTQAVQSTRELPKATNHHPQG